MAQAEIRCTVIISGDGAGVRAGTADRLAASDEEKQEP